MALGNVAKGFREALPGLFVSKKGGGGGTAVAEHAGDLSHGSVVIAAITSCTNTSNPSVMIGAGLLAKKAVEKKLRLWQNLPSDEFRQKLTGFLASRGFSWETIKDVIDEILKKE